MFCYREMEAYDLPEQLSVLQAYDMEKIGFLQDLVRGVTKIVGKQKPAPERAPAPAPTPIAPPKPAVNPEVAAMLARGRKALETGNWESADAFFERALDYDAECAEAYMGEFLALQHAASFDRFLSGITQAMRGAETERLEAVEEDSQRVQNSVSKYAKKNILEKAEIEAIYQFDRAYLSMAAKRAELRDKAKHILNTNRLFKRARQFAKGDYLESIENARMTFLKNIDLLVQAAYDEDVKTVSAIREGYARHLEEADALVQQTYAKRKKKKLLKKVLFSVFVILFIIISAKIEPRVTVLGVILLLSFGKPIYRVLNQ